MLHETVIIEKKTPYGIVKVGFVIIDIINEEEQIYGLIAQHRIVIGKLIAGNNWLLSENIDLLNISIIENVVHKGVVI